MKKILIPIVAVVVFWSLSITISLPLVYAAQAEQAASHEAVIEPSAAIKEAIRLHNAGLKGEKSAAKEANKLLEIIVKKYPKNGVAAAYFGSTYTLMARDAENVVDKVRYSNRGIRYLDVALELAPEDFLVRFIRAKVNSSLPSMFSRAEKATEDMLALDKLYQSNSLKFRAAMMTGIYEKLIVLAPSKGPWDEHLKQARITSGE